MWPAGSQESRHNQSDLRVLADVIITWPARQVTHYPAPHVSIDLNVYPAAAV